MGEQAEALARRRPAHASRGTAAPAIGDPTAALGLPLTRYHGH